MHIKKTPKILIISTIFCWMIYPAFAANLPEVRGLNMDPIAIQDNSYNNHQNNFSYNNSQEKFQKPDSESSASLKGSVSELAAIVGKSQLIRFDEPVKRLSLTNPALAD